MTTTLIFHMRDRSVVKKVVYDSSGRKVSEEIYRGVKSIVLDNVKARLPTGMYNDVTLYVLDCDAKISIEGAILIIRCTAPAQ
ncbi:MAG TPA: hypothetical protein EYH50_00865 [Pyrodictium delaneyi]|uniref:Uncharacterized protein n=1 Tax=Pyrodictium delaneyi TaxID=1273541 RepID=A0A833EAF9_9CREN|nr:hypothetical protein [Pyrodictium delaneyi]